MLDSLYTMTDPELAEKLFGQRVTGMAASRLFAAEINHTSAALSGRKVIGLLILVSVPENAPIQEECTFPVIGRVKQDMLTLAVSLSEPTDVSSLTIGNSFGNLVMEPIWRF